MARALLSFADGASKEEGIERGTIDGEGENWIGQRVRSASHCGAGGRMRGRGVGSREMVAIG